MSDQNAPPEIYLDARVARSIPTEQDIEGTPLVRYFSAERVKELVDMSRGGPEFFVQVETDDLGIFALTNYGRLFTKGRGQGWKPVELPDLAGANNAKMES